MAEGSGKVFQVAGDEVVGAGGFGTFEEAVVVVIRGGGDARFGVDEGGVVLEFAKKAVDGGAGELEPGASKDVLVFGEDGRGDEELGATGESEVEGAGFKALAGEESGDEDIGVEDDADHQTALARARFC